MTTTHIIQCGSIIFVTRPYPFGAMSTLFPSREEQKDLRVEVDSLFSGDDDYYIVTVTRQMLGPDPTPEEWSEGVRQVLEHHWNELVRRELESGPMPEILQGNPLHMVAIDPK